MSAPKVASASLWLPVGLAEVPGRAAEAFEGDLRCFFLYSLKIVYTIAIDKSMPCFLALATISCGGREALSRMNWDLFTAGLGVFLKGLLIWGLLWWSFWMPWA